MNKFYFLLFIFFFNSSLKAQNPDIKRTWHWYFGYNAGLDFSSGTATAVAGGQIHSTEACASISDKTTGQLLFYTDGVSVWNHNNVIMQNGTGLSGCQSAAQGALIVPQPNNDSIYFIFTLDCAEDQFANGFRYSTVNINLNGGLGAITQKNILIHDSVSEKLTGTYSLSGDTVWVLVYALATNNFLTYAITNLGINNNPVINNIGPQSDYTEQIKISPDGEKLALTGVYIYSGECIAVYSFDNITGQIGSVIFTDTTTASYGIEFSPDNSKLYVTGPLSQYNLNAGTQQDIINSKIIIDSGQNSGGLQLGPDGKIYVSLDILIDSNGIINNPNNLGSNCNYSMMYLPDTEGGDFPNFMDCYFNNIATGIKPPNKSDSEITFFPDPADKILYIRTELEDIEIYNLFGQLINKATSSGLNKIDVSFLPNGIYFIKSINNKSYQTIKLIIKHNKS
jgi:type IX secretion system substrate protein